MKYFIVQGLLPEAYEGAPHLGPEETTRRERIKEWRSLEGKLPLEGEQVFLRQPRIGRLSVLIYDVYNALLMISAPSQRKAYALALPFRSYLTIYLGVDTGESVYEFLIELTGKPRPTATTRGIASLYRQLGFGRSDPDVLATFLRNGTVLFHPQIRSACEFLAKTLSVPQLLASLMHLEQSHNLLSGHMTGYHYQHHYRHERKSTSAYLQEKRYLEERTVYDLAFLSAFRAMEAMLGTVQIHKREITKLLHAFDGKFQTSFCWTRWKSYHEVFSSGRKRWGLDELIARYLDIRNGVAAHANPSPRFQLREDQVFELQLLVKNMLYDAAGKPPMPTY